MAVARLFLLLRRQVDFSLPYKRFWMRLREMGASYNLNSFHKGIPRHDHRKKRRSLIGRVCTTRESDRRQHHTPGLVDRDGSRRVSLVAQRDYRGPYRQWTPHTVLLLAGYRRQGRRGLCPDDGVVPAVLSDGEDHGVRE